MTCLYYMAHSVNARRRTMDSYWQTSFTDTDRQTSELMTLVSMPYRIHTYSVRYLQWLSYISTPDVNIHGSRLACPKINSWSNAISPHFRFDWLNPRVSSPNPPTLPTPTRPNTNDTLKRHLAQFSIQVNSPTLWSTHPKENSRKYQCVPLSSQLAKLLWLTGPNANTPERQYRAQSTN